MPVNLKQSNKYLIFTVLLLLMAGVWYGLFSDRSFPGGEHLWKTESDRGNIQDTKRHQGQATVVMAEIGDYVVTEEEFQGAFRTAFERSGRGLQVTRSLLRDILDQRVQFYSTVQYGIDQGWDRDHEGLYQKNLIYRQVMVDEFKRSIIEPRVTIKESDLEELFLRYNTHVRASHLYAPDRETADSLYHLVTDGIPFESLAGKVFESASLRESGGDLGYFTVDDMDVGFEEAAFKLAVGDISKPVRTSRGFSIIKVTDRITTPIITEYQYAQSKNRIRELAIRQKTELERRSDMDRVLNAFQFDDDLISELWEKMDGYLDRDPAAAGVEMDDFRARIPELWDNRVIGKYASFEFTVGLFLQEVYYTPLEARNSINSAAGFRNLVEGTAYRSHAIEYYRNSNAYDHELVESSIENTFQNYLSRRLYQTLKTEVDIPEELKRNEFEQHRDIWVHHKEVNLAELAVRDMDTAENAYDAITSGMSFRDALMAFGFDEEAKLAGGEIGYTPVTHFGTIAPALRDIRPGDIAGPFEMTGDVIFLFKCLGVRDAQPMTFEEAAPMIKEQLTEAHVMESRKNIVGEIMNRHGAKVHYNRIELTKLQL